MDALDERLLAWAKVNLMLDRYGDSPQYRAAWDEFVALVEDR